MMVHQQRRIGADRHTQLSRPAGEMGQVIGEQPLQIVTHVDPAGAHHRHPRPVRVVFPRDDRGMGSTAAAHDEVTDPQTQGLAPAHSGLREQGEQQPGTQVSRPPSMFTG